MKKVETAEEYIRRLVKPIFDKVAKETPQNPVSVRSVGKKNRQYCIYNIHNYRLYFQFDKKTFNPDKKAKPTKGGSVLKGGSVPYKIVNSTELEFSDILGCTIIVKRKQIEIKNRIDPDKLHRIPFVTNAKHSFADIIRKKDKEAVIALKRFINLYGGQSDFQILNRWGHNKVWHEDAIDLIPIKMKWNNKVSMKLYNRKNVEFPDVALASNYIETRAIESQADEIKDELFIIKEAIKGVLEVNASTSKTLNGFVTTFMPIQADFALNIKSHTAVIKNMVQATDQLNINLSEKQNNPLVLLKQKVKSVEDILSLGHLVSLLNPLEKAQLEQWIFASILR